MGNLSDITKSTIPPTDPHEFAIIIRFESGAYTELITGVNNATGIALVELYEPDFD